MRRSIAERCSLPNPPVRSSERGARVVAKLSLRADALLDLALERLQIGERRPQRGEVRHPSFALRQERADALRGLDRREHAERLARSDRPSQAQPPHELSQIVYAPEGNLLSRIEQPSGLGRLGEPIGDTGARRREQISAARGGTPLGRRQSGQAVGQPRPFETFERCSIATEAHRRGL
jgi:hypothetical protein